MTGLERLERELRALWRPPVRLPGTGGEHAPVEVEAAVETVANHLGVPRGRTLELWTAIRRAARRKTPARKGGKRHAHR